MIIEKLGYNSDLEKYRLENSLSSLEVGRVISEHKERYTVQTQNGVYEAEILGNLRYSAKSRVDFPAVGDWVAISEYDENKVLIHAIFPRKSTLERQAVGKFAERQIIATNIDTAFIVQAVDRDFNINRLERYLILCNSSLIKPIIILTKIDLIEQSELNDIQNQITERINLPVIAISNLTGDGFEKLSSIIQAGETYCLLGSSGVGKSSLTNRLAGDADLKTGSISTSTSKGRHISSTRELIVLEKGGIIIDNPGMREVGITDSSTGIELTFENIAELTKNCRFNNCTHIHEEGCAVISAVNDGEIDSLEYENFLKLQREQEHFSSSLAQKRKKDKDFGKMIKSVKKLNQHKGKR